MTKGTTELPDDKKMEMEVLIDNLYEAFRYFNRELFNNVLPNTSISISEKKGAKGGFYADRFTLKENNETPLDDIFLNPTSFSRDEKQVLSTLVHEMAHQWEQHYGKPSKNGYHNIHWGETMKSIGLHPSSTGEPGGKETGRNVSHYIVEGGLFDVSCSKFIEDTDFTIDWFMARRSKKKATPRKITYRCNCPNPVYANKSGRNIFCIDCDETLLEDVG